MDYAIARFLELQCRERWESHRVDPDRWRWGGRHHTALGHHHPRSSFHRNWVSPLSQVLPYQYTYRPVLLRNLHQQQESIPVGWVPLASILPARQHSPAMLAPHPLPHTCHACPHPVCHACTPCQVRPPWTEWNMPVKIVPSGISLPHGIVQRPPPPPPVDRMTDTCENITFPQLRLREEIRCRLWCSKVKNIAKKSHVTNFRY